MNEEQKAANRARVAAWAKANPERHQARARRWQLAHPEQWAAIQARSAVKRQKVKPKVKTDLFGAEF